MQRQAMMPGFMAAAALVSAAFLSPCTAKLVNPAYPPRGWNSFDLEYVHHTHTCAHCANTRICTSRVSFPLGVCSDSNTHPRATTRSVHPSYTHHAPFLHTVGLIAGTILPFQSGTKQRFVKRPLPWRTSCSLTVTTSLSLMAGGRQAPTVTDALFQTRPCGRVPPCPVEGLRHLNRWQILPIISDCDLVSGPCVG